LPLKSAIKRIFLPVAVGAVIFFVVPSILAQEPKIVLAPNLTHPGASVHVTGTGLPSKAAYSLHIDREFFDSGVTLLNGTLNKYLTLPRMLALGEHVLNFTSGSASTTVNFTVVQWATSVAVSPNSTYPGSRINISGSMYPPNAAYSVYLDGDRIITGATDGDGSLSQLFQLSRLIPLGWHNITVNATQYTGPPSATFRLYIQQWPVLVSVTDNVTHAGRTVLVRGTNFPPLALYEVLLDGVKIMNGQTDVDGSFERSYPLPASLSLGNHTVTGRATEYTGTPSSVAPFTVTQWPVHLTVLPPVRRPGETVTLQGSGFPPNAAFKVLLDGNQVAFGNANAQGEFQIDYGLQKSITLGMHEFVAQSPSYSGPPSAPASLQVAPWEPILQVSPKRPHPGTSISIDGSGFPPYSTCHIYLDSKLVDTTKASVEGTLVRTIGIARNISLGTHTVLAEAVNYAGPPAAGDDFNVTQWPLAIFPSTRNATHGQVVTLKGSGFPPSSSVRVYWDGFNNIKAGSTSPEGNLSLAMVIPYPDDESYHSLVVNVTDNYTGPPSVKAFLWLGTSPPQLALQIVDEWGMNKTSFFWDEAAYANGSGFPPGTKLKLEVLNVTPSIGQSLTPTFWTWATTDVGGVLPATPLSSLNHSGNFTVIADINSNLIFDGPDLLAGPITFRQRPDLSVTQLNLSNQRPVQGEPVIISTTVENHGQSTEVSNLTLLIDGTTLKEEKIILGPGEEKSFNAVVQTASILPASYNLTARLDPVSNETNLADNLRQIGLEILSRPDIEVLSVSTSADKLRVGETLMVSASVQNLGDRPESFHLTLLIDDQSALNISVPMLQPNWPTVYVFSYDTTSEQPRNISISVRANPLPYESRVDNNLFDYGQVVLMGPNTPPVSDPGGPYSAPPGQPLLLDGSKSFDPDGTIISYEWDFGDGERGSGRNIYHVYLDPGVYVITLSVRDNEGAVSVGRTNCTVTIALSNVTVFVSDAITERGLSDALLTIDGWNTTLSDGYAYVQLTKGTHRIEASKTGFRSVLQNVTVPPATRVNLALIPICSIFASDATGKVKDSFAPNQTVFATISSPGRYQVRVYAISDRPLADGEPLVDATGQGFSSFWTKEGNVTVPIWRTPGKEGSFNLVLDVNSDGLWDLRIDPTDSSGRPGFAVGEGLGLLGSLLLITAVVKPHR